MRGHDGRAKTKEGEAKIQVSEVPRAVAAAMSIASALDLTVKDAVVLHDSNKLALRLLPCDVLARVAHGGQEVAQFEVELAQRLADTGGQRAARELLRALREGPPWPALDIVMRMSS